MSGSIAAAAAPLSRPPPPTRAAIAVAVAACSARRGTPGEGDARGGHDGMNKCNLLKLNDRIDVWQPTFVVFFCASRPWLFIPLFVVRHHKTRSAM
jgi:hypothetical protein